MVVERLKKPYDFNAWGAYPSLVRGAVFKTVVRLGNKSQVGSIPIRSRVAHMADHPPCGRAISSKVPEVQVSFSQFRSRQQNNKFQKTDVNTNTLSGVCWPNKVSSLGWCNSSTL